MCQVDDAAVEQCRWCEATHQDKHVGGKRKTSHWVWLLEFIWSEGVTVFHSWLNWLWKRWELIYDLLTINRISFDLWAGLKSSARLTLSALRHPLLQFSCFDPHVKTSAASTFFCRQIKAWRILCKCYLLHCKNMVLNIQFRKCSNTGFSELPSCYLFDCFHFLNSA